MGSAATYLVPPVAVASRPANNTFSGLLGESPTSCAFWFLTVIWFCYWILALALPLNQFHGFWTLPVQFLDSSFWISPHGSHNLVTDFSTVTQSVWTVPLNCLLDLFDLVPDSCSQVGTLIWLLPFLSALNTSPGHLYSSLLQHPPVYSQSFQVLCHLRLVQEAFYISIQIIDKHVEQH